jgi:peptidoglycan/xylan/chitin deacetylase (PgdA/CDA1 family)
MRTFQEESDKLHTSLDRLRSRRQKTVLFFRDDDVDEDETSLRRLLNVFLKHDMPVNLAVIPGRLSGPAIELLNRYLRLRPDLFEINQHGWLHINHEPEGRKCEFGPSRTFDQQVADIANGQKILGDAFNDAFSRVFTPPWNRCVTDTFRALDQLGFEALSKKRGKEPVVGYSFREISVTLDLYRWKNSVEMKAPDELVNELISQVSEFDTVGIMLHHKVMDETAFEALETLLAELRRHRFIDFHTFQSLLEEA